MMKKQFDVIVIGAGAAGLMCAATAGFRGRRVLVLDHNAKAAEKVRISGGGRCNFTNLDKSHRAFFSETPNFFRSALAQFTAWDMIALLAKHGLTWEEKAEGQLFCVEGGAAMVSMLLDECREARAQILLNCDIEDVGKSDHFYVRTSKGSFSSESLVVATGGLSIPQMGASPLGYRLAERFGLEIVECAPALVPLTWHVEDRDTFAELSGISLPVRVRSESGMRFHDDLLFTHKGVSGPAILQASSYWRAGEGLVLDFAPNSSLDEVLTNFSGDKRQILSVLSDHLPKRFAEIFLKIQGIKCDVQQLKRKHIDLLLTQLHHFSIYPNGTQGYKKAEVTRGGVDAKALSSKSLMVKDILGLFFVGEVLDVTGWLGGYNLQWAWSSGFVAGKHC